MESKKASEKQRKTCSNIFKDTYDKCQNFTILRDSIEQSIKDTKFYTESYNYDISKYSIKSTDFNIIITPDRTLQAVTKYYLQKNNNNELNKTTVLNFASGKHPGGGVWSGARSQEESICRCSTLYPCLETEFLKENFYSYHIKLRKKNTDRIIYIPNIIVFKSDDDNVEAEMLKENEWYKIDVLSCAAHNQRAYKVEYNELKNINYKKIKAIVECAIENNVDNIILGAFSYGAFANDRKIVANMFKKVLIDEKLYKYFKNVHFAIFTTLNDHLNYDEFIKTFEKYLKKKEEI